MSIIKFCQIGLLLAAALAIEGCSSVPKCSDASTTQLIEDIFYNQFEVSEETKVNMRKYLKFTISAARSTAIDEKIKKNTCAGRLAVDFDPEKLKSMVDRFVFLYNMDKFMGNTHLSPTFDLKDYQTDIEYDVQNTEKDGLYGSVSGLDKIVVNAKLLVRMGVFNNSKEVSFKKMNELKRGVGYYDVNSIVKKDDYTELLSMIDWSEFEDQKASQVEVTRFYCNTIGEIITVNRQYYSEHGGRGSVVSRKDDFEPGSYTVTPKTHHEYLWEVACNTKLVFSQPDKESLLNNELNISNTEEMRSVADAAPVDADSAAIAAEREAPAADAPADADPAGDAAR